MNKKNDVTRGIGFQRGFYSVLCFLIGWIYCLINSFSYELYRPEHKTFLLLSNHNTDLDCFSNVIGTRSHMKFVAAERVTQGFGGRFVRMLANPIPRRKGAPTEEVVELILENLRSGISVGMYAEGLKSWDGETSYISERTASLAKRSGAALITYRIHGGYMRSPHWAATKRRGPMHGEVVHEYSPEQLAAMTEDEVYSAICSDLYVNAYEYQREKMYSYRGKRLAEGAELTCYICPVCNAVGHMHSEDDRLYCDCGFNVRMNGHGFFEGDPLPFDNMLDWSRWQKRWLHENASELKKRTESPILVSPGNEVFRDSERLAERAEVSVFGDRIEISQNGEVLDTLPMSGITKLGAFLRSRISLTCSGVFYNFHSSVPISGYQYYGLWRILTGRSYE